MDGARFVAQYAVGLSCGPGGLGTLASRTGHPDSIRSTQRYPGLPCLARPVRRTSAFYGQPLVAWTPAFSADIYEVQYSKTRYPFRPELDPRTNVKGHMTFSTADVLPLKAGTWWYRVRGIDYNLPTGVQQMSWSAPQKLVVSKPTFKVVRSTPKRRFKVVP